MSNLTLSVGNLSVLENGNYFKVTTRKGMAYVTKENDVYTYTNRRGESVRIDAETFVAKFAEGYATLNGREIGADGRPMKKAVIVAIKDETDGYDIEHAERVSA